MKCEVGNRQRAQRRNFIMKRTNGYNKIDKRDDWGLPVARSVDTSTLKALIMIRELQYV